MQFAIDYGNSFIKLGKFEEDKLTETKKFQHPDELYVYLKQYREAGIIISSVKTSYQEIIAYIPQPRPVLLNNQLSFPFQNLYKTPETLGADRIAAVSGAYNKLPGENLLVIDLGTCITFDFISSKGQYTGGSISPGIYLCFKALHHYTANLPLLETYMETPLTGEDTYSSIMSGVVNGKIAEINGIIERYKSGYNNLKIFMCGGDIKFFERNIKHTIFAEENLVLYGLNHLLEFNNQNKQDVG